MQDNGRGMSADDLEHVFDRFYRVSGDGDDAASGTGLGLAIVKSLVDLHGGSIAVGHPFGMTGARCAGHILQEGQRRNAKWGVVTMCIGGGQGAAGLFEAIK